MKKLTDWNSIGKGMAGLGDLLTSARAILALLGVDADIIPWLLKGDGKKFFAEAIQKLGKDFLTTQRVRFISKYVIEVNLDASPTLPFKGATVAKNTGSGWVRVERKKDALYVDKKKVILHLEEGQKDGKTMLGLDLSKALALLSTLHPNILDALLEHTHLIPETLKVGEKGSIQFIYFWAVEFSGTDGNRYVRSLYWNGGRWQAGCRWLDGRFGARHPALVCAS